MKSFALRARDMELMDKAPGSYGEFASALSQLEILNRLTRAYTITERALSFLIHEQRHRPERALRILDIGCGYGDMLRHIRIWADKREIPVELTGIDIHPWAIKAARTATPSSFDINYVTSDVFAFEPKRSSHVVVSSLFMHHLNDAAIVKLLEWMTANSVYGWFINDLNRHPLPYYFILGATRIFPFNRLIRNDAPLSVAKSFRRDDWESYGRRAGLDPLNLNIEWHWPFRYGVRYVA